MSKKHVMRLIFFIIGVSTAIFLAFGIETESRAVETHITKYDADGELLSKQITYNEVTQIDRVFLAILFSIFLCGLLFGFSLIIEGCFGDFFDHDGVW